MARVHVDDIKWPLLFFEDVRSAIAREHDVSFLLSGGYWYDFLLLQTIRAVSRQH